MTTTPARGRNAPGVWWAYVLDDRPDGRRLVVVKEDEAGNVLRDGSVVQVGPVDPDKVLARARWRRTEPWADTGSGQCARVARMRGGGTGRPRRDDEPRVGYRARLPESLHREMVASAEAVGRSLNDEIISRCSR